MTWMIVALAATLFPGCLASDGETVVPTGAGTVQVGASQFEAFPLPGYAAAAVGEDTLSYFVEVEPGIKVHVLEVGMGYPVYLQHGNPTSGFLYRKVAAALPTDRVRVIMPTLVGLGFSTKVPVSAHTLDNHVRWIHGVLERLELSELIYAGQDWGGPIGMGALAKSPGLLKGAVVMNTGLNAPTEPRELSSAHRMARTPVIGELMIEQLNSIFERLPNMQGDPASLSPDVLALYARPVEESGNAKAPLAMMRMVAHAPDHPDAPALAEVERYVKTLDIPVELVWGMNDPIIGKGLPTMQQIFPGAPVTETEAGHFLQEEVPDVIASALLRVLDEVKPAADAERPAGAL